MSERDPRAGAPRWPEPARRPLRRPPGGSHRPGGGVARLPIVAAVLALLVAGGLADRAGAPAPPPAAGGLAPVPVAAPAAALSSSWFCAGATDTANGAAPGAVVIASSAARPVAGTVTVVPSHGRAVRRHVAVPADSSVTVPEQVPGGAPWVGAIVDVDGGAVAVEQVVNGALGESAAPCATSGSSSWYFATGMTLVNAAVELSLLNPYPTDAVVDLSFTTNQGLEAPQDFQGMVVPAGGLLSVDLGSHLRRRTAIATTVLARSGRVVAWKTDVVTPPQNGQALLGPGKAPGPLQDPAYPVGGLTVTLGSPSRGTVWSWPDGVAGAGIDERYVVYNPGPGTAQLALSVTLDQGSAEPFALTVGPEQVTTVVSTQQARIPSGVAHAAVLRSLNGVPVVAERTVTASAPATRSGLGELPGGRLAARRWLLPAARSDATHDGWVIVYNPGRSAVQVSVTGLDAGARVPLPGIGTLSVGRGKRLAFPVGGPGSSLAEPLLLQASGDVYVESDLYGSQGHPGISLSFGVPLRP